MNVKHQIGVAVRTALATCVLAAGLIALPALASISANTSGGASCKASNGNGAKVFFFSNLYAQNTSVSPQYLSCGFIDFEDNTIGNPLYANIVVHNPTAANVSITCVVQSGTEGTGTINTQSKVQTAAAGSLTEFVFSNGAGTMPARANQHSAYTVSCLMPPQSKLGILRLMHVGNFAA